MSLSFGAQMRNWRNKTEQRMELVFQESIQELGDEANTLDDKGGNMPFDTGFLVNSLVAAINSEPVGESSPTNALQSKWDNTAFILAVNKAKIGDRVTIGWTANYAIYMEARFGYMRLAAQNWPQIVKKVTRRVDKRLARG